MIILIWFKSMSKVVNTAELSVYVKFVNYQYSKIYPFFGIANINCWEYRKFFKNILWTLLVIQIWLRKKLLYHVLLFYFWLFLIIFRFYFQFVLLAAFVSVASAGIASAPLAYASGHLISAPLAKVAVAAPLAKAVVAEEYDPNPQYSFGYDVQDGLTGDSKSQVESRSGDVVQGEKINNYKIK